MGNKRYENACSYPIRGMILKLCDANSIAHLFEKRKAFCANKKARRSIRRAACSVKNIRLLMRRGRAASPVIPSPARDLYGAIVSVSFRPSVSERRNLWQKSARVLYSLFDNTDCILPSRGGVKTRSTTRGVPPRSAQGDTKDIIILLRAQKSHFLQAPSISRILAAQFGKSECGALK